MLHEFVQLLSAPPVKRRLQLRMHDASIPAEATGAVAALDTSMEAALLCTCHGAPVIRAADLTQPGSAPSPPTDCDCALLQTRVRSGRSGVPASG